MPSIVTEWANLPSDVGRCDVLEARRMRQSERKPGEPSNKSDSGSNCIEVPEIACFYGVDDHVDVLDRTTQRWGIDCSDYRRGGTDLRRRSSHIRGPPSEGATGYRVDGHLSGVVIHELDGKLVPVNVAAIKTEPSTNAQAALDFAEIVSAVATARSRETYPQAFGQTMAAIGKSHGRMACSFGAIGKGFKLETLRHDSGG